MQLIFFSLFLLLEVSSASDGYDKCVSDCQELRDSGDLIPNVSHCYYKEEREWWNCV